MNELFTTTLFIIPVMGSCKKSSPDEEVYSNFTISVIDDLLLLETVAANMQNPIYAVVHH